MLENLYRSFFRHRLLRFGVARYLLRASTKVADSQPITVRGLLALALSAFAVKQYALPESDLVAYIIGGSLLALVLVAVIVTSIIRLKLGRAVRAEVRFDNLNAYSGREVPAGIVLFDSSVPPFFSLQLERIFDHSGVTSPVHILRGGSLGTPRHLFDSLLFQHRGLWRVTALRFTIRDALGFSSLSWELKTESSIEVSAPTIPIKPLPIVAASSRVGDDLSLSRERTGDPFDIKAYDPSEGINRILWKTYARTGELVVRRPEPAIIPEGEVAIYMVARTRDDYVAGALQSYVDYLTASQITVLFGTDGVQRQSGTSIGLGAGWGADGGYFINPDDIRHAINRSVWSTECGTAAGFDAYLDALMKSNRLIYRVIIFAPENGSTAWFDRALRAAQVRAVQLTVALAPERLDPKLDFQLRHQLERRRSYGMLGRFVPEAVIGRMSGAPRGALGGDFLGSLASQRKVGELARTISQNSAELLRCEGYESFN